MAVVYFIGFVLAAAYINFQTPSDVRRSGGSEMYIARFKTAALALVWPGYLAWRIYAAVSGSNMALGSAAKPSIAPPRSAPPNSDPQASGSERFKQQVNNPFD